MKCHVQNKSSKQGGGGGDDSNDNNVLQAQQGASLDLTRRITTEVNTGRNVSLFIFNGDIS